jgi:hypothetical protein
VLKYNAITENWEPHPDLIGAGASGELTVSEIDDSPSVENVVEIVVPADRLEDLGAGKVYLDLSLDPVNGENDYWRTDTVRVASGDTNIEFSSPLPAADYIIASLYAVLDNGNRQDLQYDSLATDGFKVLSVIDSAWVHYIAIRNVDSLLASFENQGKLYATPSDTVLRYLSNTVDDSTITVTNYELTVLPGGINIFDLDGVKDTTGTTSGQILVWNQDSSYFDPTYNVDNYKQKTLEELRTVTSIADTLQSTDVLLHVTYTATDTVMIWLPTTETISGRNVFIKDAGGNATLNTIRVRPQGGTIDGLDSMLINMNYGILDIYSDGTNWFTK